MKKFVIGENIRPGQVWWRTKDGKRLGVGVAVLAADHGKGFLLIKEEGVRKTVSIEQFFFDYTPSPYQYEFRNLPITSSRPDGWCVAGGFANSGGILEWCYSKKDAIERMEAMNKDPRSYSLAVEQDDTD